MNEFYTCLMRNSLAFIAGGAWFLLTLFLVSRRYIGFTLSVIFMLISLGSTLAIQHQTAATAYWNALFSSESPKDSDEKTLLNQDQ